MGLVDSVMLMQSPLFDIQCCPCAISALCKSTHSDPHMSPANATLYVWRRNHIELSIKLRLCCNSGPFSKGEFRKLRALLLVCAYLGS